MRRPAQGAAAGPFSSRSFRLYFTGQLVSNTGSWFQNLAISLVVLQETGSATALALVTIAQFAPVFLFAPLAGWLADTVPIRRILMVTSGGSVAVAVGLIEVLGRPEISVPWLLGWLVLAGSFQGVERIAAQAFVYEMVGPDLLKAGAVMTSMYVSAARSIGPGLAGLAFAAFGPVPCLGINAVSYAAVVIAVLLIRPADLHQRQVSRGGGEKIRLRRLPVFPLLASLLLVNVVVMVSGMNMNVVITALVTETHGGGAEHLGLAHALNAVGAVAGGLFLARLRSLSFATLTPVCLIFAVALAANALAPDLVWFMTLAPVLGLGIGLFQGTLTASAQSLVPPAAIGRMMSLVTMGTFGSIPLGALVSGALIDVASARLPFLVGSLACLVSSAAVLIIVRRLGCSGTAEG
ncbi:MFS transporter [Arthrobacter sp. W4I7]|uniref:MFS transporter n=1 Tax=Arthrobacter sp. W4I7 TaxID=3042296 RepID=UPI0027803397|nr:MFS transporter [Arthrobacter sp. W4I7]MDQ0693086.1 MFS family permease [Arthrobacter sp. W4I7]